MLDDLRALSRQFIDLRNQKYQRYFIKTKSLDHRFGIILGDRGVGKTTTVIQYLMQHARDDLQSKKVLYIQSDHILLGNRSLYEIAEEFYNLDGEFIAFDEIHKYPNWSIELKSINDTFPSLKMIASGSSALQIQKGSHDLSRRAIVYKMVGMSFREYLEIKFELELENFHLNDILKNHERLASNIVKKIKQKKSKILPLFQDYLKFGYYPYFQEYPNYENFSMTLEQNIHTTIESDLAAIYPELTGSSINKVKELMAFVAQQVPFVPSWSKIKSILDIKDNRTIKTYFKYLEDASLIQSLQRSAGNLNQLESVEKIFLGNTNQLFALNMSHPETGTIRETFFLSMLQNQHKVIAPKNGDFKIDNTYTFEVGGRKKGFNQLKNEKNGYLAIDNVEVGIDRKIPLWLFGFLY